MAKTEFYKTASGKLIYSLLKEKGYYPNNTSTVAFCYTEGEDEAYLCYNFASTSIKLSRTSVNEADLEADGIKIWRTWTYRG